MYWSLFAVNCPCLGVINTYSQELVWLPWGCKDQTHVIWKSGEHISSCWFLQYLVTSPAFGAVWNGSQALLRAVDIRPQNQKNPGEQGIDFRVGQKKANFRWFQLILEIDGSIWILTGQQQQVTKHPSVASEWEISPAFPNLPKFRRQVNNITLCPQEMPSNSWTPLDGNSTVLWCSHMGGFLRHDCSPESSILIGCFIK